MSSLDSMLIGQGPWYICPPLHTSVVSRSPSTDCASDEYVENERMNSRDTDYAYGLARIDGSTMDEMWEPVTEYACEGDLLNLTCPTGHVIRVIIANYGRFSVNVCNEQGIEYPNTQCRHEKSTWIMSLR
ncbi:unnamed protein product [Soboliphyme baturini]|uniref:SUEL-type lectin domain-containing protein n=1 Tax=Soboliphyme baturini TaxID=241478 RepID=A0A183IQC1_9BILA|nr:unnamed protein product [Soboliphyme baturini]